MLTLFDKKVITFLMNYLQKCLYINLQIDKAVQRLKIPGCNQGRKYQALLSKNTSLMRAGNCASWRLRKLATVQAGDCTRLIVP